jgi:hypothetical protein
MNDSVREKLSEMLTRHGPSLIDDPRRLEALLRDCCANYKREVNVLVMALKEKVAAELVSASSGVPAEVHLSRLTQRLQFNSGLSEEAARWAVRSWASALGIIPGNEPQTTAARVDWQQPAEPALPLQPQRPHITVSQRGGGDYRTISEAIKNAGASSRIVVRPGRYAESLVISKPVEIVGEGPLEQIVIDSLGSPCIMARATQGSARNLTLRARVSENGNQFFAVDISFGQLTLEGCDISNESSACVSIHGSSASPIIRSCKIHDGNSYGIWVWDNAAGVIEDCEVYDNAGAGVVISGDTMEEARQMAALTIAEAMDEPEAAPEILNRHSGKAPGSQRLGERLDGLIPLIRRCRIRAGHDHGVWIHYKGEGVIENCYVVENALAGVCIDQGSAATIRHCRISRNGWEAVRLSDGSTGTVEGSDLRENAGSAWAVEDGCQLRQSGNME